jgi:hypothetical protein
MSAVSTTSPAAGSPGRVRRALLALVVVLAVVAVVLVAVPRRQLGAVPAVDYHAEVAAARREAPYPLLAPDPLPRGWVVTGVRYADNVKGATTWHVGVVTPSGRFAGVAQSNGQSRWFVYDQSNRGVPKGSVEVDGVTWEKRHRALRDVHSLVRVEGDVTTVVTGTTDFDELTELVRSLR